MGGTRHGKNSTCGAVYSYYERVKDSKLSGWGSTKKRLGKDSLKEFDCCSLTLQPCKDPVITPDGYLYDKEAILECIVHQKREIARKVKEYEKQTAKSKNAISKSVQDEYDKMVEQFKQNENNIVSKPLNPFLSGKKDAVQSISNMADGKDAELPAFWLPSMMPSNQEAAIEKPDTKVRCPMSGKPLKLKDLTTVNFTKIKDDNGPSTSVINKTAALYCYNLLTLSLHSQARYVCPVTNDVLSNSVPCAVLRTSGSVVTVEAVDMLFKGGVGGVVDPVNSKPMSESDVIRMQRGSVAFSGSGQQLVAKIKGVTMPIS